MSNPFDERKRFLDRQRPRRNPTDPLSPAGQRRRSGITFVGTGALLDPIHGATGYRVSMGKFSMGPESRAEAFGAFRGRTQGRGRTPSQARTLADKLHNKRVRQKRNLPFGRVSGARLDFLYEQAMAMDREARDTSLRRHTRDVKAATAAGRDPWRGSKRRPGAANMSSVVEMGEDFGAKGGSKAKLSSPVLHSPGEGRAWYHADLLPGKVKGAFTSPAAKRLGKAGAAAVGTAAAFGLAVTMWDHPVIAGLGIAGIGAAGYGIHKGFQSGAFGRAADWVTEKGLPAGDDFLKKVQNPATRADTIFDTAAKGGRGVASGVEWLGGSKLGRLGAWTVGKMANNPRKMMAMLAVTAIGGATVGIGKSGANKAMQMNQMYMQHHQMSRQQILNSAAPRDTSKQVNPTFSGRRVKGGHMGATGDLVFAMNNRRKG